MPTLTIRNVPPGVVKSLKARAKQRGHSMEQEIRELLDSFVDRQAVMKKIEASWARQTRPTTPEEIEEWIQTGRD